MKAMKKRRLRFALCALWMAVIFLFSAQTAQSSKELSEAVVDRVVSEQQVDAGPKVEQAPGPKIDRELLHVLVRKAAHLGEYAVLSMLFAYAFWDCSLPKSAQWLLPVGLSALYAVTDEVHQHFVPGRSCRLVDIGIDTCGAILGMCFVAVLAWVWQKIGNKKACC